MDHHPDLLIAAWAEFEKAARFDEKRQAAERSGNDAMARIAGKAVAKHLDRAITLEARAFVAKTA